MIWCGFDATGRFFRWRRPSRAFLRGFAPTGRFFRWHRPSRTFLTWLRPHGFFRWLSPWPFYCPGFAPRVCAVGRLNTQMGLSKVSNGLVTLETDETCNENGSDDSDRFIARIVCPFCSKVISVAHSSLHNLQMVVLANHGGTLPTLIIT